MHVNGQMRPVETVPGMGGGEIKENGGGGKFNYDIFKNFGKCHNVPLSTIIKNKYKVKRSLGESLDF
jgi:hypothetical protein